MWNSLLKRYDKLLVLVRVVIKERKKKMEDEGERWQ